MKLTGYLELFPKIGGTLAVLTGIALILLGDYGAFTQIWLIGSLVIYILIQILVVAIITPQAKRLAKWVQDPAIEPLTTEVMRFLGSPFYRREVYQAIPVIPTVRVMTTQ